jgi:hypothetical protein
VCEVTSQKSNADVHCYKILRHQIIIIIIINETGMFGGPEVSYHQTHSARDWLSILRTPYTTQNLQRERRTDGESNCNSGDGTGQMAQTWMIMMKMMIINVQLYQ